MMKNGGKGHVNHLCFNTSVICFVLLYNWLHDVNCFRSFFDFVTMISPIFKTAVTSCLPSLGGNIAMIVSTVSVVGESVIANEVICELSLVLFQGKEKVRFLFGVVFFGLFFGEFCHGGDWLLN